jgi:iron complex outermembrane recepter protein
MRKTEKFLIGLVCVLSTALAHAQTPSAQSPTQPPTVTLPPVTVVAQKEPTDPQRLPVSVTAVTTDWLRLGDIKFISDAAVYSPNTYYSDFTARKLTNPRFRGLGSSPANPAITTFVDGVPHLNTNSSSMDLLDVEQVEFARGPQSSLFGRNTLGGLVNVLSARPSLATWTGGLSVPIGDYGTREVRGNVSGPLSDRLAVSFSAGHAEREGFTKNTLTGNDLDYRKGTSAKAQLLWIPGDWEARVIVSGERARDGDYALNDLDSLRTHPFEAARDFEGHTDRDIFSTTVMARREGDRFSFSSTTGVVRWKTQDVTDLDYTPLSLITRDNTEKDIQFTQELRLASAPGASVKVSDRASLAWQAGAFVFTQNYEQLALNNFSPFVLSPFITFPVTQTSPDAELEDFGVSLYGQGTLTFNDRLDLRAGARFDRETKKALLTTGFSPLIAPGSAVDAEETFSNVSPQVALTYRFQPSRSVYASVARGFKAGGFNPTSPAGSEGYGEEYALHVEGGLKTQFAGDRVRLNAAVFMIDWKDLQLNVPMPFAPGQYFISNVGDASSRGVEVELAARANNYLDVFGSLGVTRARFGSGTTASGVDVSDNKIPNTPGYTATAGAQLSKALSSAATLYGMGEIVFYGAFNYDEANLAEQEAYSLANLRAGVRGKYLFVEGWMRNAFDTRYVPVAFAYPGLAPSGFIGESGRPRTLGITGGVRF